KAFSWPFEEKVVVFFVEVSRSPQDEETELDVDEMEHDFFDGENIEIDQLIAEQIFLALPYKILCSETCKGLCVRCGANLNEEVCGCDRSTKESPFAALEEIKDQLVS
ncbi:MAG: DUF177 domain-containing protein, partial [Desulforhabdus sp.]|nr:DUF177 domain-containing protein [Desulforhabdus sp.]